MLLYFQLVGDSTQESFYWTARSLQTNAIRVVFTWTSRRLSASTIYKREKRSVLDAKLLALLIPMLCLRRLLK